ncbi:MAG: choice-of-anchor N protein [Planctomycetota bacterium]|jgi:hypothetical protein
MMRSKKSLFGLVMLMSLLFARGAIAVPIFQTYIVGAATDTLEPDENTWVTTENAFELTVSGAYGPWTESLTDVTLLISVPEGETGTITITGDDPPVLLTEKDAVSDAEFNPEVDAVLDLLLNETGNTAGSDGYPEKSFIPQDAQFNNHHPLKSDISDFVIYDLGSFEKTSNAVSNYTTEGPIACNIADGQEKIYSVLVDGFSSVHFDVYGKVEISEGFSADSFWAINPASHDAAYMVPEPATIALLALGSAAFIRPRRKAAKA